jgi:NitT/TauT family transport system substrate-binding protein
MSSKKRDRTQSAMQEPTRTISRRNVLIGAGIAGLAGPIGIAHALPRLREAAPLLDESAICRTAAPGAAAAGPLKKLTFSWNASGVCLAPLPLAVQHGIFAKHGLDVELVNFGGSTDQLLEAIATGKSDAGVGMALRWLKPLEQGFDVKITAGTHGGCMRLLAPAGAGIDKLEDLKGKVVATADMGSPDKNFFSILLAKKGIDPVSDVEWRQYPGELLRAAVDKGEAQALTGSDPRPYLWLKDGKLKEVSSNLAEQYAHRTCCIIGVRASLLRSDKATATALTRAILEAAVHTVHNPQDAAKAFQPYAPNASLDDLKAMVSYHTHHHNPIGDALKKELALYSDELKSVSVIKPSLDTAKFADRIYADVLS